MVRDIDIVTTVLITGANPNTKGMMKTGLPPKMKAKMIPSAPIAPMLPAKNDQKIPEGDHLPWVSRGIMKTG